jgi:hypothetical protein
MHRSPNTAPVARPRRMRRLAVGLGLVLAAAGLLLATQGSAMAKMVMFSAVSGKVLHNGKPVAGAAVEREFFWAWKSETGRDSTQTDAGGNFRFALVERSSLMGSLLPHEPIVRQTILIKHEGKTYKAWMYDKRNYRPDGEIGRPIVMTCKLESELHHTGDVYGICDLQ